MTGPVVGEFHSSWLPQISIVVSTAEIHRVCYFYGRNIWTITYLPFSKPRHSEGRCPPARAAIADVPFFLPQVSEGNLRLMNAIVGTLSRSPVPRLSVRSRCADWGIGAEKLYQILFVMESVGLLRIIRRQNDTTARSVGAKLLFADATLYPALRGNPGTTREALVAALLADSGRIVEASRDETLFDVHDGSPSYDVGGPGKSRKRADIVIRDDVDLPSRGTLPLWMLGLPYRSRRLSSGSASAGRPAGAVLSRPSPCRTAACEPAPRPRSPRRRGRPPVAWWRSRS